MGACGVPRLTRGPSGVFRLCLRVQRAAALPRKARTSLDLSGLTFIPSPEDARLIFFNRTLDFERTRNFY